MDKDSGRYAVSVKKDGGVRALRQKVWVHTVIANIILSSELGTSVACMSELHAG